MKREFIVSLVASSFVASGCGVSVPGETPQSDVPTDGPAGLPGGGLPGARRDTAAPAPATDAGRAMQLPSPALPGSAWSCFGQRADCTRIHETHEEKTFDAIEAVRRNCPAGMEVVWPNCDPICVDPLTCEEWGRVRLPIRALTSSL